VRLIFCISGLFFLWDYGCGAKEERGVLSRLACGVTFGKDGPRIDN